MRHVAWPARRAGRVIALLLVAALLPVGTTGAADLESSSQRAADQLLGAQQPSGLLHYGYDFLKDAALDSIELPAVQLGRQGVASMALADHLGLTQDPREADAVAKMLAAFGRHSLPVGRDRLQSFVAWTRIQTVPVGRWRVESFLKQHRLLYTTEGPGRLLSPDRNYANAYAGSTGLALLTEVRYARATGDQRFASLRAGWLEGLMALRIPGDGFRQIPDSIDTHPYYDGEPWLALAEYHRSFPDDARVAEFLADVDDALLGKYAQKQTNESYHWSVMAAAARYADTRDARFLEFIRKLTPEALRRLESRKDDANRCAMLEGLVDAMGTLQRAGQARDALYERLVARIRIELRRAWAMQIEPGQTDLVYANARISAPRLQDYAGAFRNGTFMAETQIDTTAHCLSAMVKLRRQKN